MAVWRSGPVRLVGVDDQFARGRAHRASSWPDDMCLGGVGADDELIRDLLIGPVGGDQGDDLTFPVGDGGQQASRGRPGQAGAGVTWTMCICSVLASWLSSKPTLSR